MSIGVGKPLGRWKPLLVAAAAVLGVMLAFAPTATAQTGYSSNDQYKNRSSQYDQYNCGGCERQSSCPNCGTGVGRNAREIIGGQGGTAGQDDFSTALEAAQSQHETPPTLAAETGIGANPPKPSGTPVTGFGTDEEIHGERIAREVANEGGDRSQVRDQEGGPEDGRGSGRNSVAGRFLGGSGTAILGASIVGTLLMAGFLVSRGSLRG